MTRIITVIVDEQNLTMYKADGSTIIVAQGDPRIRGIVEKVVPAIEKFGFYELTDEDLNPSNTKHFTDTEVATSGVVKFFRMAKKKLAEIAAKFRDPIAPLQVGVIPEAGQSPLGDLVPVDAPVEVDEFADPVAEAVVVDELKQDLTRGQLAVAEIMANASSTSSPAFHKADVAGEEETVVVAIVDGETVIPDVDKIEPQLKAIAAKLGTATGVTNFFRRLAQVKRNHSVVDLLKFMEKGELPIADDGTILVYKRLNRQGKGDTLHYTDVHSGQVKQKVGSHVFMAEALVDPNRNNDCSNGLHIARRDYLSAFSGNVVVLCKLAPEDVISVPIYDARKLRCKGYTIVAELNDTDARLVSSNRPMEDTVLLGNVAAGNHTEILETVEITKARGGGLIVTPTGANKQKEVVNDQNVTAESLDKLPEADAAQAKVNARDVALSVAGTKTTNPDGSISELVDNGDGSLGVLTTGIPIGEPVMFDATAAVPIPAVIEKDVNSGEERLSSAVVPNSARRPVDLLVAVFQDGRLTPYGTLQAARGLLAYKKQCKKSWTALGVPIAVWEKATQMVDTHMTQPVTAPNTKLPSLPLKPVKVKKADSSSASKAVPISAPKGKSFKASAPAVQNIPKKTKRAENVASAKGSIAAQPQLKDIPKKVKTVANAQPAVKKTQAQHVAGLMEVFLRVPCKSNAMAIVNYKRTSKKSWDVLEVDAKTVKRLMTYDK